MKTETTKIEAGFARAPAATLETQPATLVDLLDRLLDRGLVLDADIVISLAGIPLIGISLRAAIAGMETMLQHGVFVDWDQQIRAAAPLPGSSPPPLAPPEPVSGYGALR